MISNQISSLVRLRCYQDNSERVNGSFLIDIHLTIKMSETVVVCQIEETLRESLKQFRFSKTKKSCAIIMKVECQWYFSSRVLSSILSGGEREETDRGGGSYWGVYHRVSHGGAPNSPAQICGEDRQRQRVSLHAVVAGLLLPSHPQRREGLLPHGLHLLQPPGRQCGAQHDVRREQDQPRQVDWPKVAVFYSIWYQGDRNDKDRGVEGPWGFDWWLSDVSYRK